MAKAPKTVSAKTSTRAKAARPEVTPLGEQLAGRLNPTVNDCQLEVSEVTQAFNGVFEHLHSEFERSYAPIRAEMERVGVEVARMFAARQASFECLRESIIQRYAAFAETIAPVVEEQRIRKWILDLGFVPHAVLLDHLGNVEKPSHLTIDEFSQALADEVWPKVRASLQLSIEDCLGDPRIFRTFDEIIRAHEAGLYQLTAPSAFFVIERAARLAQRDPQRKKTFDWLKNGLGDLTLYDVPTQWRSGWTEVWALLYEKTFCHVQTDDDADSFPFPHRHASAHGIGGKINDKRDSINCVLLAHFVISAAAAFQSLASSEPVQCPQKASAKV
jgi:hypothetical protein